MPKRQITLTFEVEEELAEKLEISGLMTDPEFWLKSKLEPIGSPTDIVRFVLYEFANSYTSNKGYLAFLLRELVGSLTSQQKDFLTIIEQNNEHLWKTVQDARDVARFESGKNEIFSSPVSLHEPLNMSAALNIEKFNRKDQKLIANIDPHSPLMTDAEDYLSKLLSILLDNASKFSPTEGIIEISADYIDSGLHIQVKDNGIGISEEDQKHLFEPYFRSSNHQAYSEKGNGLGLYIARYIVNAHKGKIWIESELGKGTTVHVILPVHQEG